ncbi:hypothetical protein ILUMI_26852 [Ignelater luminosus]|uniref:Uncharacterized protein n=1 Tax=Ignelater luminosus TaxID=2038154 RepID=A0A8K0C605_IGNLU|nr:hypothetical protein ILUMI_26852 [Ignelater luminosus]
MSQDAAEAVLEGHEELSRNVRNNERVFSSTCIKRTIRKSQIFNADKKGVSIIQRPGKIIAEKGLKQVGFATNSERKKNVHLCPKQLEFSTPKKRFIEASFCGSDKDWIAEK